MEQCPICFTRLEIRECAPCDDCGWDVPAELEHLRQNLHTYTVYETHNGPKLTLCDFCAVDFGSCKPEFLGLKGDKRMTFGELNFVRQIEHPGIVRDKFCPECSLRLKFLKFVVEMRRLSEE